MAQSRGHFPIPMSVFGTHSPFAALHKSGSYRGFIWRAFDVARPVGFDPKETSQVLLNGSPRTATGWMRPSCDDDAMRGERGYD